MVSGILNKIPYDQEIIHISHLLNNRQLIGQLIFQFSGIFRISLCESIPAQFIQIFPRSIAFRHIVFRKLGHTKLNLHITTLCNLIRIFQSFRCIGKQRCHLFRGFNKILTAFITHTVLIRQPLASLQTEQDIMRLHILRIRVVHIIGCHQFNSHLPAHAKQRLIDLLLFRHAMILQLQKEIIFSKDILIAQGRFTCFLVHPTHDIAWNLSCQTSTQCNDTFMICFQRLNIHARLIVKSIDKPDRYNLHQILVALVIFRQQHQMIITIFVISCLFVKPGTWCHIDLASQDRLDSLSFCFFIKINHTIHDTMVSDSCTVHAQFLDPCHIFLDLIGSIQQTVFCMHM